MGLEAISPAPITAPARIGDLILDVLMEETENLTNTVTTNPVEDGSPAADHIILNPDTLTITGMVTNSPIRSHGGPVDSQARATIPILDHVVGTALNFAELARNYLVLLRKNRTPITVITKRGRFENMVVQSFRRTKDRNTGDALIFTVDFLSIRKIKLKYVAAPTRRTTSARAQPRTDAGKATAKTATSENRLRSTLYSTGNAVGNAAKKYVVPLFK
jgi:hypothetical protein